MPKLYEYLGLIILFYSNDHEPIHVHAKCQGREGKAAFIIVDGVITDVLYSSVRGRRPLTSVELRNFKELIEARSIEIVQKWIDYFVHHKNIEPEYITQMIR